MVRDNDERGSWMAKKSVAYNFKPNSLFRGGPNYDLNACVGENGGPYDLRAYGQGFFDGAKAIIDTARDRRFPVDILVYPAAFSFRHGIELYLKHLLTALRDINLGHDVIEKNHSILGYFELVAKELVTVKQPFADSIEIGTAKDIIADFEQIDPTGQVFRYPEDLKGNAHLTGLKLINVAVLDEGMDVLREILEGWMDRIEYIIENMKEL
jgi:hypothetical protein